MPSNALSYPQIPQTQCGSIAEVLSAKGEARNEPILIPPPTQWLTTPPPAADPPEIEGSFLLVQIRRSLQLRRGFVSPS